MRSGGGESVGKTTERLEGGCHLSASQQLITGNCLLACQPLSFVSSGHPRRHGVVRLDTQETVAVHRGDPERTKRGQTQESAPSTQRTPTPRSHSNDVATLRFGEAMQTAREYQKLCSQLLNTTPPRPELPLTPASSYQHHHCHFQQQPDTTSQPYLIDPVANPKRKPLS